MPVQEEHASYKIVIANAINFLATYIVNLILLVFHLFGVLVYLVIDGFERGFEYADQLLYGNEEDDDYEV